MPEHRIPVPDLPDGVVAVPLTRGDGTVPRDRRGRVKVTRVQVRASGESIPAVPGDAIVGVSDRDQKWISGASLRRGVSIDGRFGPRARTVALALAAAGVVELVCAIGDDLRLGTIQRWRLTDPWDTHRRDQDSAERDRSDRRRVRASAAAESLRTLDPGLAEALLNPRIGATRLSVLIHAAEDLAVGVTHDGPRAFSQTHFETTKDHDDVASILTEAGADPATLVALGLLRSPYLGLGGPVTLRDGRGRPFSLAGLDGPVQIRATNRDRIAPTVPPATRTLAIIENLQAAEAVCTHFPATAVLWCAGQPADAVLDLVAELAEAVDRVVIATDADLGGVRIAARISAVLTGLPDVVILDVGAYQHPVRQPFGAVSQDGLAAWAESGGPAAAFARACLARGYPVEQEATIRSALHAALAPTESGRSDDF